LVNIDLSDSAIEILHDKTEGWIIALRLAAMIIKSGEDLDKVMLAVEGGLKTISDYLISEVLSKQPEHIRDRLLKSSILNRFCDELLDAIDIEEVEKGQQRISGEEILLWLRQENMFVVDLDNEGKWFRYHQLFQSLLQVQLQNQYSKDEIVDLHLKSSRWFENHDFLEEAMYHPLAIENYDRAAEIVKTHRLPLLNTGNWYLLERLWMMLPTSITEKEIELLLIDGYLGFYHADLARMMEVSNKLEPLVANLSKDSGLYGEFLWNKGYSAMFFEPGPVKALELLTLAKDKIPLETAPEPLALTELYFSIFSQVNGKYEFANNWLEERIRQGESTGLMRRNRFFLGHAIVNTNEARLFEVEKYYLYALKIARESKILDYVGTCLMMAGEMFARQGQWNRAVRTFKEVIDIKYNVHSRAVIECMTGSVVSYCMQGKTEKAQDMIKSVKSFTHDLGEFFEKFLWSCRLRYHMLVNDIDVVRELLPNGPGHEIVDLFFWFDVPEITHCHALIREGSEGNLKVADEKLKELVEIATSLNNPVHLIEIYALQALLYDQKGKLDQAQEALVKSIELAERGNVIAYYIEIGKPFEHLVSKMPDEIKERKLMKEIDKVMKSTPLFSRAKEVEKVPSLKEQKEKLNILTSRELEVLTCVAEGLRNQEIADKLFNSEETIKKHISNMFQKLNVKNRLSLVTRSRELNILEQ
jgi:LuxR family maltose regulon positive regulatory protein